MWVLIWINLDVDVKMYVKIFIGKFGDKFGIFWCCVEEVYVRVVMLFGIKVIGIDMYIGL